MCAARCAASIAPLPLLAAAPASRRPGLARRGKPPLGQRSWHGRIAATDDDPPRADEELLRRAEQLQAARAALDAEAAALAAALGSGQLTVEEERSVLAALGLAPRAAEEEGGAATAGGPGTAPQQQQQKQQQQERQRGGGPDAQPPAAAAQQAGAPPDDMSGEQERRERAKREQRSKQRRAKRAAAAAAQQQQAPQAGSPEWRAALPPELRQAFEQSGLAEQLDRQSELLRRDQEWGTSDEAGGGDMEAVARLIEDGGDLLPLPGSECQRPPEPGDEFVARLQGSIDYANADLKGSRHLAAPGSGAAGAVRAAAEAAAARVSSSSQAVARAVEYSQEPRLAAAYARGWEQGTEVDRLWESGEARKGLIGQEEIMRSVPAPLLPPDVQAVFRAAERLAYVLRRAHVDSEDPDAPLRALRSRGLASEKLLLVDPFVTCRGLGPALKYMQRLRLAGATVSPWTFMLRCPSHQPLPQFYVTIDCLVDFPYPPWLYSWACLNGGLSSAAARRAAAAAAAAAGGTPGSGGPYAGMSAAAVAAAVASGEAARQRQQQEDAALLESMLAAAQEAAAAAGQELDAEGTWEVLEAAAGVCLRRRRTREEAAEAAAEQASQEAQAAQRRWEEDPAGAAAAAASQPPEEPRLVAAHTQPYSHDNEARQHTWVLADFERQSLQRGVQRFLVYPRSHPPGGGGAGGGGGSTAGGAPAGGAFWQGFAEGDLAGVEEQTEEEAEAEQQRQYSLLPTAGLLQPGWGREEWAAEVEQTGLTPPPSPQQQEQRAQPRGAADAQGRPQPGSGGKQGRQRRGSDGGAASERQQQQQTEEDDHHEQQQRGEQGQELFPFTWDWDKQRRRREAGQMLRTLLGRHYDKVMGQLPRFGRTRGASSNSFLAQEAEQEGTAWLSGRCMTVQATFDYRMDPATCLVDWCGVTWGAVHGVGLHEMTDAWDIWMEATGLLHEAECAQDAAQGGAAPDAASRGAAPPGVEDEAAQAWRAASVVPLWRLDAGK
ncbi:hypothetical protein C2E20_9175 [Micractinium conductrix]|uniref:Uncharacterized protein n=1 Tax=Micractinium conductrix TaxID=554055 RepID=A0A2P6UZA0_9CHLO|nr:hypothetical protein C2E20_9175 [Micractinium conductrix]|eukprot:PSC67134.1 hypothetical protein C2E20_9175 [Micractinium conductrix]